MLSPTVCNPHISITHSTTVIYQNITITDWQQAAPLEKSSKRDEWKYLISRHTEKSHPLDYRQNDGFEAKGAGSSIPPKTHRPDNKENTF